MRFAVAVIALVAQCVAAGAQQLLPFGDVTKLHVVMGSPRQTIGPVFANSYTGLGPIANQWKLVDLTQWGVPTTARWAFFTGFLIITHGSTAETADLQVTLRATGDTGVTCTYTSPWYIGQTVEAAIGGGQRSNMAVWVPLVNGTFEWCWTRSTAGTWPANSAYGVNLSLEAYAE